MQRSSRVFVFEEAEHLVAAIVGRDKFGVGFNVINEPLLMLAELEVVVLLAQFLYLAVEGIKVSVGVAVFFGEKTFLFGGIKTDVLVLIKFAGIIKLLEDFADDFLVADIGGAHEVVV